MEKHYNRQGSPISRETFHTLKYGTPEYKIVARTTLPDRRWVSTVWLGWDYRIGPEGPPIIFETMVFASEDNLDEERVERYSTEAEALTGHERIVKKEGG